MTNQIASHWTREGSFVIRFKHVGGSEWCNLVFEKEGLTTDLGLYAYVITASESISGGEHDKILGFSASSLGVPADFKEWNGR
jgi:hypothetical protein